MANNIIKWKAARRLFDKKQRCDAPPHFCGYVEGPKCEDCKYLKKEMTIIRKEIKNAT